MDSVYSVGNFSMTASKSNGLGVFDYRSSEISIMIWSRDFPPAEDDFG